MADDYAGDTTTTGVLALGGAVSGNLETADDTDWFRLNLAIGHGYLFNPVMQDGNIPTVTVWQAGNSMPVYTTATGNFSSNVLANPFVPWEQGAYYLEVSGAQAGGYTVGMREAPDDFPNDTASALALTTAAPVAARFDYAFDRDLFRIAAVAGSDYKVTISVDSGSLGTASFLRLGLVGDRSYTVKAHDVDATTLVMGFTARTGGNYVVYTEMASHYAPAEGGLAYHVSVVAADFTGPRALAGDGTVDGAIHVAFDEPLMLGASGRIELKNATYETVDSWEAGDARIHVKGASLTLDPGHARMLQPGSYRIAIGDGILTDAKGNTSGRVGTDLLLDKTSAGGLALSGTGFYGTLVGSASTEDIAIYAGNPSNYTFARHGDKVEVARKGAYVGDMLTGVERLVFKDSKDVVALSLDGHLGQAYRLYKAAFDRAPEASGLGFWLHSADVGVGIAAMARGFLDSEEYVARYPGLDDAAFVASLYQNVLHREGDAQGVAFWNRALGQGVDRADVLAAVSESQENQEQVAALVGNGILYTPYG